MSTLFHRHRRPVGFVRRSISDASLPPDVASSRLGAPTGLAHFHMPASLLLLPPLLPLQLLFFFRRCRAPSSRWINRNNGRVVDFDVEALDDGGLLSDGQESH